MSWKVSGLVSVDSEEDADAAISNSSSNFGVGVVVGTRVQSLQTNRNILIERDT